jgi:hypothetical protein
MVHAELSAQAVNPDVHLFPYITGFMAQTWFQAQWEFDQPNHSAWWLKDPATGHAIDCNDSAAYHWCAAMACAVVQSYAVAISVC